MIVSELFHTFDEPIECVVQSLGELPAFVLIALVLIIILFYTRLGR